MFAISVSAYFGDLKDGTHKGDETDPRISVIEVVPEEIRYWMPTKGAIGRAIDAGVGAMTGRTSAPGELRTITKAEVGFPHLRFILKLIKLASCASDPVDTGLTF